MDMAHLISNKKNHVEYELTCPVCKKDITIKVKKAVATDSIRYPFEYVDIHGTPAHGITLYIDKNWSVRGMEIFKNINVQIPGDGENQKLLRVPEVTAKINPMARQLGIISNKEYEIIETIDGETPVEIIAQNLEKDFEYVFEVLQGLVRKNMVKIKKINQ